MQDTSFAIHPGNEQASNSNQYYDIGALLDYEKTDLFHFRCERGWVSLSFYADDIVRITMKPLSKPTLESSFALIKASQDVHTICEDHDQYLLIKAAGLHLKINKNPFRISAYDPLGRLLVAEGERGMAFTQKQEIICFKEMDAADHFYGFGEKTGFLDKRGENMTMWNTDVFAPHNPETDALYESIPYFMTIRNGFAHGIFFDNTYRSVFDLKSSQTRYSFGAEGGELDYYILAGPTPKDVITQYTTLTGRMDIPPKWALGYHQSRYSYKNEQEVRELVRNFKNKEIPVDAIYLDIHYMDGYRVFTFDYDRFPHAHSLIQELKAEGINIVPIVDPGVKQDAEYPIYQEGVRENHFCKYLDGNIYVGEVWPGISAFPDFSNTNVRKWWGQKQKFYTDMGIEGIWNDMNEPAVFNETKTMDLSVIHENDGNPKTHRELHNIYGLLMGEATYTGLKEQLSGKRPFVLTRAGYAGVQRYAAVWTGDNRSFWEHMQMAIPMCMNLGLSGVPFTGPDVGGFAHDTTGELLTRWTQLGTFTPYFRNHSNLGTVAQEPWAFGEEVEMITKKYIELRYKWLPHLYTLFREAHQTGLPVMRPLVLEYPNDPHTSNLSDQFLIGENVLIAPITRPATYHRVVYLPEGTWYDYWTDTKFDGGKHIMVSAPLDTLPIFVKEGAIIPEAPAKLSTKVPDEQIMIHLYPSQQQSEYILYEDDGSTFSYQNNQYLERKITCHHDENQVEINIEDIYTGYSPSWKSMIIHVHGVDTMKTIYVNGEEVKGSYLKDKQIFTFELNQ
ncbi:glycoside hydrolase family 31 protein [Brevibacillus halotolerans]|uniref:glycoside hydrolase family 31 protein n=1 Tax=Brevibacillus TaxID=55080 RepID=UPI00215D57A0|nr:MULTISPECIES: glycoside hydrolase family 31 protein [Brevibacillus]MCR8964284.1 glycoside hydrolase family 31 protein [Brevibacillus laterosporus]MCZ0836439.1 glycoside hydrolase family 31 protein [Brevibacillus halotolerans]